MFVQRWAQSPQLPPCPSSQKPMSRYKRSSMIQFRLMRHGKEWYDWWSTITWWVGQPDLPVTSGMTFKCDSVFQQRNRKGKKWTTYSNFWWFLLANCCLWHKVERFWGLHTTRKKAPWPLEGSDDSVDCSRLQWVYPPLHGTVYLWLVPQVKSDNTGMVQFAILGYHSQLLTMEMLNNVHRTKLSWPENAFRVS